jgi:hypothetical protein
MTSIESAYINALLADAAYIDLRIIGVRFQLS